MKAAVYRSVLLIAIALLITGFSAPVDSGSSLKMSDQPIDITSQKFMGRSVDGGAEGIFEGHVKVTQADWNLKCDRLSCLFERQNKSAKKEANRGKKSIWDLETSKIKTITGTGNVQFDQGVNGAKAGKGVYDHAARTITLTEGPPHFWIEGGEGEAEAVIIYIDEKRMEFLKPKFRLNPKNLDK